MDEAWAATLADKDYVFPTAWAAGTWLLNLLYPVVIAGSFLDAARRGVALRAKPASSPAASRWSLLFS